MKHMLTLLAVLLSACMILLGCQEKTKPEIIRPVKAVKLEKVAGFGANRFPGRAEATTELNLGFEAAGTLLERPVNKGDSVEKGQLLARLDPRDFENEIAAAVAQQWCDRHRLAGLDATVAITADNIVDRVADQSLANSSRTTLVLDMLEILLTEVPQGGQHRIGSSPSKTTHGSILDNRTKLFQ